MVKNPFRSINRKKAMLAFEFGIVLSDAAHDLKVPMTREIVEEAEKLLEAELVQKSAKDFALNMNVYTLALLKPKD